MTGDIAYSGKQEEYEDVAKKLIVPLRRLPNVENARFIAVPGNHDVDCDKGFPPSVSTLANFLKEARIEGVDPTECPATVFQHQFGNEAMSIVCSVTSYFSSKHIQNERQNVPAPIHALRSALISAKDSSFSLVLGHHPTNWFTPQSQSQLESLLVDNNAIYLHGHEHRILANFGRRGLTSLGFGALYQSPLESQVDGFYQNSFAICELHSSLHVDIRTWDSQNGRWTKDQHLPANFDDVSDILSGGRVLPLPTTLLKDRITVTSSNAVHVLPMIPRLSECYWLAVDAKRRWLAVLEEIGLIDRPERSFEHSPAGMAEGHLELRLEDARGGHRVMHVVSAHGDVVSHDLVVSLNTLLDVESLSGCAIVSLGEFSEEAKTLVAKLGATKPITAIDRLEFARLWLMGSTSPLVSAIRASKYRAATLTLVITDESYAIIVADRLRNQWFHVIHDDGETVDESHELVHRIRQEFPAYQRLPYGEPGSSTGETTVASGISTQLGIDQKKFDRSEYLARSFEVFDDVRYAPLAALGFRFKSTSLSEVYIDAGADVGGELKADQGLQRAINEYVESLDLEPSLRDQLESQLRSQYGLGRTAEVGAARKLYQRYGCVVILGDPGSGKTCFVKHEILAYCQPPAEHASWYAKHLPIYVGLSEAAELLRSEKDFLAVCSTVAARNRLRLSRATIEAHLSDGRAAFFFDGLDEVSRIGERVELLSKIELLVAQFARYGNRFVLTSRPAAVQPVDIPSAFTYLHLRGLSDGEIRMLAERILMTRLGPAESGAITPEERALVAQFLEHVRNTPGLRRISTNPLLLTLLILIYANTGSLTARRHLVYTQAVKTLVTVRHRETMEEVLSEADLRTHLGRLAFAIYRRDIGELPTRGQVVDLLIDGGTPGPRTSSAKSAANEFLRKVAESTGILVIHSRQASVDPVDDIVSFMHYSFLEYYAAVGFLARDFEQELAELVAHPHWRDVVTLMFGLRSEHYDVTPQIEVLVDSEDRFEEITNERLFLAFECALECDVPPRETQALLAERVKLSLTKGAMRHSEYLRESASALVEQMIVAAGGELFEDMIAEGLRHTDATVAAAFVDLAGRLKEPSVFDTRVIKGFEEVFASRKEPVVRSACIGAATRRLDLRTDVVLDELRISLSGNLVEKHAALEGIEKRPELSRRFVNEVTRLLDDSNALIASSAARCILVGGLLDSNVRKEETGVRKALSIWQGSGTPLPLEGVAISLDGRELRNLLGSDLTTDVELGARLLPLSDLDDKEVYRVLVDTIHRGVGHSALRACLDALRMRDGALDLMTLAEMDFVCGLVGSRFRDVRIGAVRILGSLPYDELVVGTLCQFCGIGADGEAPDLSAEEEREGFGSLAIHARNASGLQRELVSNVLEALPGPKDRRFGDDIRQRRLGNLMFACERVGGIMESRLTRRLLDLVRDFRTPSVLKIQALRTFGRTVSPSVGVVDELVRLLGTDDRRINEALYAACYWFLGQCRKRVDFVRAVYARLPALRDALIKAWSREIRRSSDRIDAAGVEDLRRSLGELQSVLISYEDFSDRMKLSDGTQH